MPSRAGEPALPRIVFQPENTLSIFLMIRFAHSIEQPSPEKCTAFVLPICDLSGFQRFLRKLVAVFKTRVTVDFPCISGKIEYDSSSGCNLRVGIESYLRSHSYICPFIGLRGLLSFNRNNVCGPTWPNREAKPHTLSPFLPPRIQIRNAAWCMPQPKANQILWHPCAP